MFIFFFYNRKKIGCKGKKGDRKSREFRKRKKGGWGKKEPYESMQ
jgi:hypothetical protein